MPRSISHALPPPMNSAAPLREGAAVAPINGVRISMEGANPLSILQTCNDFCYVFWLIDGQASTVPIRRDPCDESGLCIPRTYGVYSNWTGG